MVKKLSASSFLQKNFVCLAVAITILGAYLRFYNYSNRWGLAYDQAHDALVARGALDQRKIPLLGPFSSAGPFQTGGEWYWLIMIGTQFNPSLVLSPWVFLTSLYVLYVMLLIYVGKELYGEKYGLVLGLLGSISTAGIAQSVSLTNQTPLAFISLLCIWCAMRCVKTKSTFYFFALGFFVSLAISIHLQGTALASVIIVTFLFSGIPTRREIFFLSLGLLLPAMPLLWYDVQNDFTNVRHMLQYYLVDQYKISLDVLGRRWLTYLTEFWPKAWSHMIGGQVMVTYALALVGLIEYIYCRFKKENVHVWTFIICCFGFLMTIIRYARVPLFDSFVFFTHPFVLMLTAFSVYFLLKHMRLAGLVLLIFILGGTVVATVREINYGSNFAEQESISFKNTIYRKFPSTKFAVYDYNYLSANSSLPFVLYMHADGNISDVGRKIGFSTAVMPEYWPLIASFSGKTVFDLSGSSSAELKQSGWQLVNPNGIYLETEEWRQYHD